MWFPKETFQYVDLTNEHELNKIRKNSTMKFEVNISWIHSIRDKNTK